MGLMFIYGLSQCSDWRNCRLEQEGRNDSKITKVDPAHWHLHQQEGGDWIFKTRGLVLAKLVMQVNYHYDRLYDEEGKPRV